MKIGSLLKEIRISKNLTQDQARRGIKISQAYLSLIEKDEKEPMPPVLRKICKFYKVPHQIVMFKSIELKDVPKEKQQFFLQLKPVIDSLCDQILKP